MLKGMFVGRDVDRRSWGREQVTFHAAKKWGSAQTLCKHRTYLDIHPELNQTSFPAIAAFNTMLALQLTAELTGYRSFHAVSFAPYPSVLLTCLDAESPISGLPTRKAIPSTTCSRCHARPVARSMTIGSE
jgi:hypothetical protein